jgi:dipeptidyl aminopeptidase/acylaminoacyl peptidase
VVALATRPSGPDERVVVSGHGFYGAPRVDGTGERLAVVTWDRPDMPWDASRLLVVPLSRRQGDLVAGEPANQVAGGGGESVGQPRWARDGTLRFVSDRRGWWQPYAHPGRPDSTPGEAVALTEVEAEWHGPDWVLGLSTFVELADGTTIARVTGSGRDTVVALPGTPGGGAGRPVDLGLPCVSVSCLCPYEDGIAAVGSTPETPPDIWVWTPTGEAHPLAAGAPPAPRRVCSVGEPFTVPGRTGRTVRGMLYRPAPPPDAGTVPEERPPLVVWCHSGPTSAWQAGLDLSVQYFTSRGFAVAGVDYAGSTGYGRAYRCSLWGGWGEVDAEDCLDAALHLAARGEVDPTRLAVRGSSAGGMTALNALAAGEGFRACASWYGVTDLLALVAATHDFEAHSTDRLIGRLPEAAAVYEARSPVHRATAMHGDVLLLHGTDDPVVPFDQAERLRAALHAAGRRCDLRAVAGEGHGFRRAESVVDALEAELAFYLEVLDL